jgi:alanyl-tRNA synthetase
MSLAIKQLPQAIESHASPFPATRKLFYEDYYATTAEGMVIHAEGAFLILDRSLFYAESGGQESDTGFVNACRVLDVKHEGGLPIPPGRTLLPVSDINVDTTIVLTLEAAGLFKPGDKIRQSIDWDRRYQLMRQHSVCHFVFFAIQHIYASLSSPMEIRGCHTSPTGTRLDFLADLQSDQLAAAESYANELISFGLPISMTRDPNVPDVFYWRYSDLPLMPCGGTHVRSASELGPIRLRREKKGKGLTRISARFASND